MTYPLVFFHGDTTGGLLRLQNRLFANGLVMKGVMDITHSNIPETLQEVVTLCHLGGAIDTEVPTASVPYRSLVEVLGAFGLL